MGHCPGRHVRLPEGKGIPTWVTWVGSEKAIPPPLAKSCIVSPAKPCTSRTSHTPVEDLGSGWSGSGSTGSMRTEIPQKKDRLDQPKSPASRNVNLALVGFTDVHWGSHRDGRWKWWKCHLPTIQSSNDPPGFLFIFSINIRIFFCESTNRAQNFSWWSGEAPQSGPGLEGSCWRHQPSRSSALRASTDTSHEGWFDSKRPETARGLWREAKSPKHWVDDGGWSSRGLLYIYIMLILLIWYILIHTSRCQTQKGFRWSLTNTHSAPK